MQEAALAVRLEDQLTKDEIYEIYLNTVYFGGSAYGIKAAAEVYFGLDLANKTQQKSKQLSMRDLAGLKQRSLHHSLETRASTTPLSTHK